MTVQKEWLDFLREQYGTGGNNVPLVAQRDDTFCITGNAIDRQPLNGGNGIGYQQGIAYTLTATDHHAVFSRQRVDVFKNDDVASTQSARQHKDATDLVVDLDEAQDDSILENETLVLLIRRLTPLECERLQGFPDGWTDIEGASDSARYSQIADEMTQQGVRYHQHNAQWNKHMVKRILENERYLGMDGYPQLVTDEEFLAVRLRRGEQNTYAPCPSEIIPIRDKAVCALCGEKMARDTKSHGRPRWRCKNPECGGSVYLDDSIILERVVQKLKVLAHSPACIQLPKAAPASTDALRIENELALCFNRADINPEYMKTLIMAAAAERYAGLNDPTPAHRLALLRQKLELEPENEETLWELFESAVTHVCIGKGGEISLSQKDQKECAS